MRLRPIKFQIPAVAQPTCDFEMAISELRSLVRKALGSVARWMSYSVGIVLKHPLDSTHHKFIAIFHTQLMPDFLTMRINRVNA